MLPKFLELLLNVSCKSRNILPENVLFIDLLIYKI